jgi:hypothetical protein
MLFNVKNAEILLSLFPYTISKLVPVVPARLMVGIAISDDVQCLWMILPT